MIAPFFLINTCCDKKLIAKLEHGSVFSLFKKNCGNGEASKTGTSTEEKVPMKLDKTKIMFVTGLIIEVTLNCIIERSVQVNMFKKALKHLSDYKY